MGWARGRWQSSNGQAPAAGGGERGVGKSPAVEEEPAVVVNRLVKGRRDGVLHNPPTPARGPL